MDDIIFMLRLFRAQQNFYNSKIADFWFTENFNFERHIDEGDSLHFHSKIEVNIFKSDFAILTLLKYLSFFIYFKVSWKCFMSFSLKLLLHKADKHINGLSYFFEDHLFYVLWNKLMGYVLSPDFLEIASERHKM